MLISEFLENHYLPHNPSTKPGTVKLHKIAIAKFGEFLGHRPTLADLTNDNVGKLIAALYRSKLAPATVNTQRSKLLALWRHANLLGLIKLGPIVKEVVEPQKLPTALTVGQLNQLILNFDQLGGETGGIANKRIMPALFAIQFFTGARIGEVRQLEWRDIRGNVLTFRAEIRKCGKRSIVRQIPQSAVESIESIRTKRREIFPALTACKAAILYNRLFDAAGIDRPKWKTSHLLRSTHATMIHAAGGNATDSLGHLSDSTTRKSYLDPRFESPTFLSFLPVLHWG